MNYEIKELMKEDLEKDKNGFLETLGNLSETEEMSLEDAEKILFEINSNNGTIYVAKTSSGKIIGTAKLLIEQKFTHGGGKVGHIEDVAVRKEYEGNGIATKIIKEIISRAKKEKCYKIILDCKNSLLPFYQKFGFHIHENCLRLDLNDN
ncbi:Acetyltransferase (GNAT) family protein [uncultured archaeon]|nr:Acetyltransferase (GNAT) family protein [uncultured archaeon]